MFRQREGGRTIPFQGVTLFTTVEIRSGGELTLVFVLVTVETLGESEPVERLSAFGLMTLCALHRSVLQQQGVRRRGMLLDSIGCRFETLHRVT